MEYSAKGLDFFCSELHERLQLQLVQFVKMLRSGWKMSGDEFASITMKRGAMVIKFDIIIPTKNEALYCACFKRTVTSGKVASGAIGKDT